MIVAKCYHHIYNVRESDFPQKCERISNILAISISMRILYEYVNTSVAFISLVANLNSSNKKLGKSGLIYHISLNFLFLALIN